MALKITANNLFMLASGVLCIVIIGGFCIGLSDFVPTPLAVTVGRVFAAIPTAVIFIGFAGVKQFNFFEFITQQFPKGAKPGPLWRYFLWAPLMAFGCWGISQQFFGNVVPCLVTTLTGDNGTMVVAAAGTGGHYYASPRCFYPRPLDIPEVMLGHRALCFDRAGTPSSNEPAGDSLVLVGTRSRFGIRVESYHYTPSSPNDLRTQSSEGSVIR